MQAAMQPPPYVSYGPGLTQVAAAPVPAAMMAAVVPQHEVGFKPHQRRTMTILSALQIAIGISCATIYIVLIPINRRSNSQYNGGYGDEAGAGIWCGGLYIIAGSLGVAAARRNRLSLMISSMVFCILSSLILWVVVGFAIGAIDTAVRDERLPCSSSRGNYYPFLSYDPCYVYSFGGYKTADSLLIILSSIELVISIWCSVLCCKGSCKACCRGCCYEGGYGYQTQVIYTPFHSAGQHVMFVQQSGVVGGQAASFLPTQPLYVGMQQPLHVAFPPAPSAAAAAAASPPGYQPAVAGLPEYSTHIGNVAASSAACQQPGEVTKDEISYGH